MTRWGPEENEKRKLRNEKGAGGGRREKDRGDCFHNALGERSIHMDEVVHRVHSTWRIALIDTDKDENVEVLI